MLAILAACGSGTGGTGGGTTTGPITLKIATDLPVSGQDTSSGKPAENGAHLAVDQANANHTVPNVTFQFVPKDDVGPSGVHDPAIGAQNVTALAGDARVVGVVGPFNSNVAKAEMPITNKVPLAQISPANTNPCLTKDTADAGCNGSNNLIPTLRPTGQVTYFRVATTDDHQGPVGADYLYKTLHITKVYVTMLKPMVLVSLTTLLQSLRLMVAPFLVIVASRVRRHPMSLSLLRSPQRVRKRSTLVV